jgi:hypothetical protein
MTVGTAALVYFPFLFVFFFGCWPGWQRCGHEADLAVRSWSLPWANSKDLITISLFSENRLTQFQKKKKKIGYRSSRLQAFAMDC